MKINERDRPLGFKPIIIEKKQQPGVLMTVGGVFQRAETLNANKRKYPRKLWQELLADKHLKTRIEKRQMVGMLGHPASGTTDPEKISHVITKQELRSDDTIYGEADILDTPTGRITATLAEAGVTFGVSSRGDGSVEKKGDYNEVQSDYKLETYDFVLKPSTDGAYPELVEDVNEHERLVAEAIDGLVNSEIPEEQRLPVLMECLQILSVLEAENSGDRVKTISAKITEELAAANKPPEVLISIVADESVAPESDPNIPQEVPMTQPSQNPSQNSTPTPQLSGDMLMWHQNQVANAVNAIGATKDQEISSLKNSFIAIQRESTEFKKKLAAAEELIEDFQKQIKDLTESGPADAVLQERYKAAVELLDESLKRLPEIGENRLRISALEGLLEAAITKVKTERIDDEIGACLAKIPESMHVQAKVLFEACSTPEQVGEHFKALMALTGNQTPNRDPLPNPGNGKPLDESMQPGSGSVPNFQNRLGKRLSLAV